MRMWAVTGPQGIIGIDKDSDKAWAKAALFYFDDDRTGMVEMREFMEDIGCTCRELEVKEVEG